MNNSLAPILVCVYDRIHHFKQCVESLKRCKLASESDIYIMSDGPARLEDIEKVDAVREYVDTISGFKNVYKIFRYENWGVPFSCREAFTDIIRRHKKIIFMEDDIVVSPNFLQYMNDGLNFYEDDKRIYSISGYCPPIDIPKDYKNDIFLTHRFNPWGYGTWLDRSEEIDLSFETISKYLKQENNLKRYRKIGNDVMVNLLTWPKDYYPGDYSLCFQMVKNNLFSVTPVVSKTNNIGNDGSGVHCRVNSIFQNPDLDGGCHDDMMVKDIQPDSKINDLIKRFHTSFSHDLKYLLYKTNILKYIPDSIYYLLQNMQRKEY